LCKQTIFKIAGETKTEKVLVKHKTEKNTGKAQRRNKSGETS